MFQKVFNYITLSRVKLYKENSLNIYTVVFNYCIHYNLISILRQYDSRSLHIYQYTDIIIF